MSLRVSKNAVIFLILAAIFSPIFYVDAVQAAQSQIRAVLFFSESCPHCHDVMNDVLPPLVEKYPGQLDIVGIDVGHPVGMELYQAMLTSLEIPDDRIGVPALVVGDILLVGTTEIEAQFPEIITKGLGNGGIDWPKFAGLPEVLASQSQVPVEQFSATPLPANQDSKPTPAFILRFQQDPVANSAAVIVLLGMIAAGFYTAFSYLRGAQHQVLRFPNWAIPLFAVLGLGVAAYLTYIELSHNEAICGPVGNCNSVQQSEYSRIFGIIPMGILGLAGYIAILAAWIAAKYTPLKLKNILVLLIWGFSWFGLVFSIYLTFLEPFVIGATCLWCLSSAILMTLTLLASTESAKQVLEITVDETYDE